MTAMPDPRAFSHSKTDDAAAEMTLHPQVSERFWGYEVRTAQAELRSGVVIRVAGIFAAVVFSIAALGLMVLPVDLSLEVHAGSKGLAALMLMGAAVLSWGMAARCRKIKVQVDTRKGEIRQVTRGPFGAETVLTCHGLDAVRSVKTVVSSFDGSFGQIQVDVTGYGPIVAGDGAVSALRRLQGRIAADCCVQTPASPRAKWAGSLAA